MGGRKDDKNDSNRDSNKKTKKMGGLFKKKKQKTPSNTRENIEHRDQREALQKEYNELPTITEEYKNRVESEEHPELDIILSNGLDREFRLLCVAMRVLAQQTFILFVNEEFRKKAAKTVIKNEEHFPDTIQHVVKAEHRFSTIFDKVIEVIARNCSDKPQFYYLNLAEQRRLQNEINTISDVPKRRIQNTACSTQSKRRSVTQNEETSDTSSGSASSTSESSTNPNDEPMSVTQKSYYLKLENIITKLYSSYKSTVKPKCSLKIKDNKEIDATVTCPIRKCKQDLKIYVRYKKGSDMIFKQFDISSFKRHIETHLNDKNLDKKPDSDCETTESDSQIVNDNNNTSDPSTEPRLPQKPMITMRKNTKVGAPSSSTSNLRNPRTRTRQANEFDINLREQETFENFQLENDPLLIDHHQRIDEQESQESEEQLYEKEELGDDEEEKEERRENLQQDDLQIQQKENTKNQQENRPLEISTSSMYGNLESYCGGINRRILTPQNSEMTIDKSRHQYPNTQSRFPQLKLRMGRSPSKFVNDIVDKENVKPKILPKPKPPEKN